MSLDYQKGRYDELVERHKELLELYRNLEWHALTNIPRSGVSGGMVNYHAGVDVNPKTIGWSLGGTGIAFSVMAYFLGLVPITFGVALSVFGILYGVLSHFLKGETEREERPIIPRKSPPKPSPQQA